MADLYWPFDTSTVSEWCGSDRGNGVIHCGTDFAVPQGTELRATVSGTIKRWENDGLGAHVLDIIRGDGLLVRNAHLSEMFVGTGDWVEAGQVIGRTGGAPGTDGAGYSTGPHLHWELRWDRLWNNGEWADPRTMNPAVFGQEQPIEPNQRVAGSLGVFRRAEPTQDSEHLEGDLEAGVVGTFDGWINGENRNGNPVWFRGAFSGNWFWSGAFTDSGTHDLADLNPAPVPVTPAPEPAQPVVNVPVVETPAPEQPAVVEPTPEPTPEPVKETPVPEISDEKKKDIQNKQEAFAGGITPISLGSIITNPRTRKIVWAVYGITGLVLLAIVGGMNNAGWLSPDWFLFIMGSYIALGPAFSGLAIANIKE